MSLLSWLSKWTGPEPAARRRTPTSRGKRPGVRLRLEALEDRCVPSTFYAATASDLIADIKAANLHGGANTIVLTAPNAYPYVLTAVDNTTDGPTVLPVIAKGDSLTIVTGGASASPTLDASCRGRLFDVAQGASLTLEGVTLQNGRVWSKGGAIYNQGTLVLSMVYVHDNTARANLDTAGGGGIWSNGSLTVENHCWFYGNSASATRNYSQAYGGAICIVGGTANITDSSFNGYRPNTVMAGAWYSKAYGGAVYVGGGTVTLSGDNFSYNSAQAGDGVGDICYGGGLCVAGGTVTLTNDCVTHNVAGSGGYYAPPPGYGGGIYIGPAGKVYLDSSTLAHTQYNHASDIYGQYVLLP